MWFNPAISSQGDATMKLARGLIGAFTVIILLIVAATVYVWMSLDSIVEAAIEKYGSEVTQTKVSVGGVKLALTEGDAAINGLTVGNPAGFSQPHIFSLGEISTRIDIDSLTSEPIVIKEIIIRAPQVFYEINAQGKANLNRIKQNITASSSKSVKSPKADERATAGEVKLHIRRVLIEGGQISAKIAALDNMEKTAKLPRIELKNIGSKQGGASGTEIAEKILSALVKQVGPAVTKLGVDKYLGRSLEEVQSQTRQKVEKKLQDKLGKDGAESLKNLLGD